MSEEAHAVDALVVMSDEVPSVKVPVAVNANGFAAVESTGFCGEIAIEVKAAGPTVKVVEPQTAPAHAWIVTCPVPTN
jgi:hypothetical protein